MDELDMGSGLLSILNEVPDVDPDLSALPDYDDSSGSGTLSTNIEVPDGPILVDPDVYIEDLWKNKTAVVNWSSSNILEDIMSCGNSSATTLTCFKYNSHYKSEQVFLSFKIATVLTTLLVCFGLLFNTLGIIVFLSQRVNNSSTRVYLLILAISDNCYLIVAFLSRGLEGIKCLFFPQSSIDIYHQSDFTCKALQYLFDLFSDFSACIIVAFTIERFLACYYAIVYKEKCNSKFALRISFALFVVIAVVICPYHMLYIKHDEKFNSCKVDPGSVTIFTYFYMVEASLFRILPIYLIAFINILIVAKLWQVYSRKKKRRFSHASRVSTSTSLYSSCDTIQKKNGKGVRDQNTKTTLMLMFISTFYLLCYQPIIICYVINKLTHSGTLNITEENLLIFKNYSRVLYIWGYTVNFFFYTLASGGFRQEIKRLCCLSRNPDDRTSYFLTARSSTHRPSIAGSLHELERERKAKNISHV